MNNLKTNENIHLKIGLIHYYYGNGRGKTSTSIGTIVRAIGHGLKPILIQFLKLHDENTKHSGFFIGEIHFLNKFIPIKQFGAYNFLYPGKVLNADINRANEGLKFAKDAIFSKKYDLVVLDEITEVLALKLINVNDIIEILKNKPEKVEIILTGATYIKELEEISNYCTRYDLVHHPYYNGYEARPGIEF